ncbi:unnamed protein product [Boreogadus saida]
MQMNEADSVVKVAEWQQTYYAHDSGIQSGATTLRDDESSTEYSLNKKYAGGASTAAAGVSAGRGGDGGAAEGDADSPTGEVTSGITCLFLLVFFITVDVLSVGKKSGFV